MRILVTGSEGFIGSHLVEALIGRGHFVRSFIKYNYQSSKGWLNHLKKDKNLDFFFGDIEDYQSLKCATKNIDIIVNLAALISIPYSYIAPRSYVNTNIIGTLNILEIAKEKEFKKIIMTSTSEVYGSALYVPMDEKHPLQAQSPYSASKIAADNLAISFYKSFDLPVIISRPFNTFGPRQSTRAIIPTIISQIISGKEKIFLGDTSPTRDFNYIEDTVDGFVRIIESKKNLNGEIINLGSGYEISIKKLFLSINSIMGSSSKLVLEKKRLRPKKSEVTQLLCDNKKARKLLNWGKGMGSNKSLTKSLEKTVEWFSNPNNLKNYNLNNYEV
jgi:NAD dependent epimerase/dehydratase